MSLFMQALLVAVFVTVAVYGSQETRFNLSNT